MFESLKHHIPKRIGEEKEMSFAVLIPLIKKGDEYHVLFEVRAKHLNKQPGEVCFPGGKVEPGESTYEAAVRETMEELFVKKETIQVYGALDYLLTPYQTRIEPFLAELHDYHGQFSRDEVDSVFTVPLDFFLENEPEYYSNVLMTKPQKNFPFADIPNGENYPWAKGKNEVCLYRYKKHVIWGMTARLLLYNIQYIRD